MKTTTKHRHFERSKDTEIDRSLGLRKNMHSNRTAASRRVYAHVYLLFRISVPLCFMGMFCGALRFCMAKL